MVRRGFCRAEALVKLSMLLGLLFSFSLPPAHACDCKNISTTPVDAFKRADAVLIGKVVKEDDRSSYFRVAKMLKGEPAAVVRIFASERAIGDTQVMSACDRHFKGETSYIIFARKGSKSSQYFADPCAPHCEAGKGCSTKVLADLNPLLKGAALPNSSTPTSK